jgi:hypothetical protein
MGSIQDRLQAIENGLNSPTTVPEIGMLLTPFGYDAAKISIGQSYHGSAKYLDEQQQVEYGEQFEATEAVNNAWNAARAVYGPTLALARVALKNDTAAQTALGLTGHRKESLSGWIDQATTFYNNLLNNADWVTTMTSFNRPQTTLEYERSAVQALADANMVQEREKGEAQKATRARDEALETLYEWYADYRDVAAIALADHPEWMELIRGGEVQ